MPIKLKKKLLFLIGGSGKIGKDIAIKFLNVGYKVIILDIKKTKEIKKNKNLVFENLNLKKLSSIEKKINSVIKKYGIPDTLINASYPTSKNWINSSVNKIKFKTFIENVNIHLGSFYWSAKNRSRFYEKKKIWEYSNDQFDIFFSFSRSRSIQKY